MRGCLWHRIARQAPTSRSIANRCEDGSLKPLKLFLDDAFDHGDFFAGQLFNSPSRRLFDKRPLFWRIYSTMFSAIRLGISTISMMRRRASS